MTEKKINGQDHTQIESHSRHDQENVPIERKTMQSVNSIRAKYNLNFSDLEKFFTIFLSSLSPEEAEILFKIMLKLFSLPKGVSMKLFQSGLAHDMENPEDLKKIAFYDQFKWTIKTCKTSFTEK